MANSGVDTALLTVPGNLLLLGEYAILEEGGLGVAVAIERRVLVGVEEADELSIVGERAGGAETWKRSEGRGPGLLGAIVAAVERELGALGLEARAPSLALRLDSSAFFDREGRKLGLGSSAAVAVGTAQALLRRAGLEGRALMDSSLRAALDAHRSHQGGGGSGYDVAASLYGGLGLFSGGKRPSFERLELAWLPPFSLVRGQAPVDSGRAIGRYMEWRGRKREAAKTFLEASNEVVRGFAAARDWAEASALLMAGARLGLELGEAIGVSARIEALEGRVGKALGAGDELGAIWRGDPASGVEDVMAAEISAAGPLWRE